MFRVHLLRVHLPRVQLYCVRLKASHPNDPCREGIEGGPGGSPSAYTSCRQFDLPEGKGARTRNTGAIDAATPGNDATRDTLTD